MTLLEFIHLFHFMRPWLLLLAIPALALTYLLFKREHHYNAWQQHIEPSLLQPLLQGKINKPGNTMPLIAAAIWLLAVLALAGPSWDKLPQAVEKKDNALVILIDLSPSMLAGDAKPSRLVAARHKILDLLKLRKEGYTALIAYSGDAHVVSPLTDDTLTVANLLNVLEPGIMPVYGSNVEQALTLALQLFQNGGYPDGDILLVTDGMTPEAQTLSKKILDGKSYTLSIIGVGTDEGAPIPARDGGFIKNRQGGILMPQLHEDELRSFAHSIGGYYSRLQLSDNDIEPLVEGTRYLNQEKTKKSDREFDQWRDMGIYLTLLLLPLSLFAFRRGVLLCAPWLLLLMLACIIPLLTAPTAEASENASNDTSASTKISQWLPDWDSLWLNDNQRAMKALENKDYETAAKTFKDPEWKASAQYEHGEYKDALKQFQANSSANGLYNQGNALAKSGQLPEAIAAYESALKQNPGFNAAAENKKIVEELMKKQPQNKQDEKPGNSGQQNPDQKESGKNQGDEKQSQANQQDSKDTNPAQSGDQREKAHEEKNKQQADTEAQRQQKESEGKKSSDKQEDTDAQAESTDPLTTEQKQQLDQALRRVPDDPSGLLRNKFEYYYQKRLQDPEKKDSFQNDEERW